MLALFPPQRTLLPRPSENQSHNVCSFSILSNSSITGKHWIPHVSFSFHLSLLARGPVFGIGSWSAVPGIPLSILSPDTECGSVLGPGCSGGSCGPWTGGAQAASFKGGLRQPCWGSFRGALGLGEPSRCNVLSGVLQNRCDLGVYNSGLHRSLGQWGPQLFKVHFLEH